MAQKRPADLCVDRGWQDSNPRPGRPASSIHHPSDPASSHSRRRGAGGALKTAAQAIALQKLSNKTTAKTSCPTFRASILPATQSRCALCRGFCHGRRQPRSRRMRRQPALAACGVPRVRQVTSRGGHFLRRRRGSRRRRLPGRWCSVLVPAAAATITTTNTTTTTAAAAAAAAADACTARAVRWRRHRPTEAVPRDPTVKKSLLVAGSVLTRRAAAITRTAHPSDGTGPPQPNAHHRVGGTHTLTGRTTPAESTYPAERTSRAKWSVIIQRNFHNRDPNTYFSAERNLPS